MAIYHTLRIVGTYQLLRPPLSILRVQRTGELKQQRHHAPQPPAERQPLLQSPACTSSLIVRVTVINIKMGYRAPRAPGPGDAGAEQGSRDSWRQAVNVDRPQCIGIIRLNRSLNNASATEGAPCARAPRIGTLPASLHCCRVRSRATSSAAAPSVCQRAAAFAVLLSAAASSPLR